MFRSEVAKTSVLETELLVELGDRIQGLGARERPLRVPRLIVIKVFAFAFSLLY